MQTKITEAIASWDPLGDAQRWRDERFNTLAASVFRRQFEKNDSYRTFCENRGVSPNDIRNYRDIPAAPTDAFKHVRLTTAAEPTRTFRTSGTTAERRGAHHFETLAVYHAALAPTFRRFCLPDLASIRMLVVAPSARDLPDSSLSFMLDELVERYGDAASAFFVTPTAEGELRLDIDRLRDALAAAESEEAPTMVLGTAFAFAEFFERCDASFELPEGSRIMETGGFKGRTKSISKETLYELFDQRLGVPRRRCVSEYSMTELSSQAYTDELWRNHRGLDGNRTGVFQTPPWVRVEIVDPLDFKPLLEPSSEGLIRWYDLANTESVVAIQTSDRGRVVEGGGFRLLGRADDAQLRGCSLTIEEIVEASEDDR
ncbi:MAG: acyl-protein synthetase [Persicimonas sp.]